MRSCIAIEIMALTAAVHMARYEAADPFIPNIGVIQSTDAYMLASTVLAGGAALVSNTAEVTTHTLPSDIKFCAGTITDNALASGLSSGVVLATGWVGDLTDPNVGESGELTFGDSGPLPAGATGTSYDPCSLKFQFTCPSWANTVQVQYVFASEDYTPSGTSQAFLSDQMYILLNGFSTTNNIALVPSTTLPVSSQTINSGVNSQYYIDNTGIPAPLPIQSNGLTTVLTASGPVSGTGPQSIEFLVTDINSHILDSWLIIQPGSLSCMGCPSNAAPPTLTAVPNYQAGDTYHLGLAVGYVPVSVDWGDESPMDSEMTHHYMNNGTYTILVTAKYSDPACFSTQTFTISIEQTVTVRSCTYPTVTSSLSGATATISLSSLSAGFTVSIDWGNGVFVDNEAGTTFTNTYNGLALYQAFVTVSDQRGCSETTPVTFSYCNAPPVPTFSSLTPKEGSPITVSISTFSRHVAKVDWDDGSPTEDGATSYTHTFSDNGSYLVKVSTYTDTGCGGDTTTNVTVVNARPDLVVYGPSSTPPNVQVTMLLDCDDSGVYDTEYLFVNWGDTPLVENVVDRANATSSLTCKNVAFTHTYTTPGLYKITGTVMDKDISSHEVYKLIYVTTSPISSRMLKLLQGSDIDKKKVSSRVRKLLQGNEIDKRQISSRVRKLLQDNEFDKEQIPLPMRKLLRGNAMDKEQV